MAQSIGDEHYIELWKYFEARADKVKDSMFTSVTTFARFRGYNAGVYLDGARLDLTGNGFGLKNSSAAVGASLAGVLLCAYSLILIVESRKHITRNWARARRCRAQINGLDVILKGPKPGSQSRAEKKKPGGLPVWSRVLLVLGGFSVGFVGMLVWAVAEVVARGAR